MLAPPFLCRNEAEKVTVEWRIFFSGLLFIYSINANLCKIVASLTTCYETKNRGRQHSYLIFSFHCQMLPDV